MQIIDALSNSAKYSLVDSGLFSNKGEEKTNVRSYFHYRLRPFIFKSKWKKRGKRRKWLKKIRVLRRWRFNRRSAKVWKKAGYLNTQQIGQRRLKVLKDYNTKKILLDFLSWKFQIDKDRIRFLVSRNFKRRGYGQDFVGNVIYNVLSRWDSILFYTRLVKNRAVCAKLIKRKFLRINGELVKNVFELQKIIKVGDSIEILMSKRQYFKRYWCKRKKYIWPNMFEYSRRANAWVLYRKLNYAAIARYKPQFLRFLAHPLLTERILNRLRYT